MSLDAIQILIREAIGLDGQTIGRKTVDRVIQMRMQASGYTDIESYLTRLKESSEEMQLLIDDITVPETWFFRDGKPFALLAEYVKGEWLAKNKKKLLKILSIPCATGEEPYSIAMALRDLGMNENTLLVDAVDISLRALARAKRALFGENSFRGDEGHFRERYFIRLEKSYFLNDSIKKMVNFIHASLIDEKFRPGDGVYDIIFCRNLLIYFDREVQQMAIEKLHRLLSDDGILVVGHAEGGRLQEKLFKSVRIAGTYAFTKRKMHLASELSDQIDENDQSAKSLKMDMASARIALKGDHSISAKKGAGDLKQRKPFPSVPSAEEPKEYQPKKDMRHKEAAVTAKQQDIANAVKEERIEELEEIQRLADGGELVMAAARCERYLSRYAANADGYYLLGLIREASGNEKAAEDMYLKAVYLEPSHYQALVHLAALSELHGDIAAANVYRQRAMRAAVTKK